MKAKLPFGMSLRLAMQGKVITKVLTVFLCAFSFALFALSSTGYMYDQVDFLTRSFLTLQKVHTPGILFSHFDDYAQSWLFPTERIDYIANPKPSGYRSLHLIVDVPVPLNNGEKNVRCEIQLRTTAMDSWAGLEHNMRYKKGLPENAQANSELRLCADMLAKTDKMMQSIAEELGVFDKKLSHSKALPSPET